MSHTVWRGAEDDGATVGDPSALFEQAVTAYVQGRFAITISHLRRLERAAAVGHAVVDARHAALRGALAARARNWTECCDWYERALAFSLPGDHACQQTLFCFDKDCTDSAGALCGQCDRWFCPEHGAEREDGVARCGPCIDVALHNLVQAAILADRVGTAMETLASWARTTNWAAAKALLACLAPEEAANLGEQTDVPDSFAPDRRAALLLYRASRTLHPTDLERVCVPESGASDSPLPEAHEWLRPWVARRLSRTGRHLKAWRVRYEEWLARPLDTAAVHALALTALRVFAGNAETDDRVREEAARQAIACWAMVLHSVSYWRELGRHSGRSLTADERKAASDALTERIRQALRDEDRTAERPTVDSLELAWELELAVARDLPKIRTDVLTPLDSEYDSSFGPGFLDLLSSAGGRWKDLVADVHGAVSEASGEGDEIGARLEDLLSPEGRYLTLLESGRFDEVIADLEAETTARHGVGENAEPLQGPRRLLGAALFARARAHVEGRRWAAAIRDFEGAAAVGVSLTGHEEEIGRAGVHAAFALSRNRTKVDWQAYVGLLERVLVMAPQHEQLRRELAAGCVRLGEQVAQRNEHDEARVRFARAYELDPSNESAVAALNAAETRSAERLLEGYVFSRLPQAIEMLRGVLDRDETFQPARRALAGALYEHALDAAVNDDRADALSLMQEVHSLSDRDSRRWSPHRGPKYDIATGLYERAVLYDELDEDDLRETLDLLAVARSYEVLPEISDLQVSVLADLVELLSADENYDEAIALVRRCPKDVEDRSRLDTAVAEAYARRARRHLDKGDNAAARSDTRSARKYASARQLSLFQVVKAEPLW
ncbi:tetratricopeptide repeat protein [Streptomyces sp. NPDC048187]|uniref:tetratricopeptide repeat protein n=1 Tax=Streptomyces sp. NPDC048187 TaxID=3365509 RepID=UPI00371BE001